MKTYLLFSAISLFTVVLVNAQRYELAWNDEFNGESLDLSTWIPWTGTAYNNEDQYYTPRDTNIYVQDGNLHLVGLREDFEGRNWTSARIKTQGNADFLYGLVEIRAKLPAGKGLWPAFWMMPTNSEYGTWPYSGEMDIMEYRGHQPNRTQGTIHFSKLAYPGSGSSNADRRYMGEDYTLEEGSLAEDFHIYKFVWTDTTMSWFLNDVHFLTITKSEVEDLAEIYPFNKEFYIILNLAIGGNYLGSNQPDETTPDRNEVIVDYVRVYNDVNSSPDIALDYPGIVEMQPGEEIDLSADVTDSDGNIEKVEFYIGGELIHTSTNSPYSFPWSPAIDGCFPLQVKAYDNDNAVSTSTKHITFEVGTGCERVPYEEVPQQFPGIIELEKFDLGGNGNSYFDKTPGINTGNSEGNDFRQTEAVDLVRDSNTSENYLVTDTEVGEWIRYTIEVTESGIYDFELRATPDGGTGRVDLMLDGEQWIYFTRLKPEEGEDYIYKTREEITLDAGIYDLEVQITQAGIMLDRISGTLVTATSNENLSDTSPDKITLLQNYPNPFNPTTTISVSMLNAAPVKLQVYNSLGQYIETLFEGSLTQGTHSFHFDASNLSSGVYYSQLIIPDELFQTQKMLLLK